jgi:hypothetical protein
MPSALNEHVKEINGAMNFSVNRKTSIHLAILARKENRSKVDELRLLVQQKMGQLGIEQQQKKRERSSGDTADISVKESRVGVLTDGSIIGD